METSGQGITMRLNSQLSGLVVQMQKASVAADEAAIQITGLSGALKAPGRKGGKKTGRKGFPAMTGKEADRIRALATEARKAGKIGFCKDVKHPNPLEVIVP